MAADVVIGFATVDLCTLPVTPISSIQGSGLVAAITGPINTQGVVVGDYEVPSARPAARLLRSGHRRRQRRNLRWHLRLQRQQRQREPRRRCARQRHRRRVPATDADQRDVRDTWCGSGTVSPVDVTLPFASARGLERFEGMLVRLPQTLYVTEHFQLGRFGQVVVSSGGRLAQPTSVAAPGAAGHRDPASNDLNRLVIDDGTNLQNPDPIAFGRGGLPLSAANTLRGGDTATGTIGVMTYTWAGNARQRQRLPGPPGRCLGGGRINFATANPRPPEIPAASGSLRVASMNVLNFFNTFVDCTGGVGGARDRLPWRRERGRVRPAVAQDRRRHHRHRRRRRWRGRGGERRLRRR